MIPDAKTLASDLLKASLADTARRYGVTPSAICVKLRRAGTPRGETKPGRPAKFKIDRPAVTAGTNPETVVRITASGARVTLPRVSFIDGPAVRKCEAERGEK